MVENNDDKCKLCSQIEPDSFNSLSSQEKQETSLLLGNGLILSHPEKGKGFEFSSEAIEDNLIETYQKHYQDFDFECPEKFLDTVRIEIILAILKHYKDKFTEHLGDLSELQEYVSNFANIFTTNYDPVTYLSIFNKFEEKQFNDGFVHTKKISADCIAKKLEGKKGIYYLHGAFHLIYWYELNPRSKGKTKHLYRKLVSKGNFIDTIIDEHESLIKKWRNDVKNKNKSSFCVRDEGAAEKLKKESMLCGLESRDRYKKAWIKNDPYLDFCFKKLGEQAKILTLGSSFKNDDHLLECILLNENLESLQIGVYDKQDQKNVCLAYQRIKDAHENQSWCGQKLLDENCKKITFVSTKNLEKIIWPEKNSTHS